jgi:hypothetical protein
MGEKGGKHDTATNNAANNNHGFIWHGNIRFCESGFDDSFQEDCIGLSKTIKG